MPFPVLKYYLLCIYVSKIKPIFNSITVLLPFSESKISKRANTEFFHHSLHISRNLNKITKSNGFFPRLQIPVLGVFSPMYPWNTK